MTTGHVDSRQIAGPLHVADVLHRRLIAYVESAYPLRDESVIAERRLLLEEDGTLSQEPYIEVTPAYPSGPTFEHIGLPPIEAALLTDLANAPEDLGIFNPPYEHQADALKAVLSDRDDVLVTTGTGSGKTEVFLQSILASLAKEATSRPQSWMKPGMRALVLYPMNALVSDQLTRIRRLFGSDRLIDEFISRGGRPARFGMYTSRTPYPGLPNAGRDKSDLQPILDYFLQLESDDHENHALAAALRNLGRRPAKNLTAFASKTGQTPYTTGARDAELLTRHEMQRSCPDILITNYSMLEYMMLRPIERNIFDQTRDHLAQDPESSLLLILDEAHMYRGVGGGEVAYLIRRLLSRLGISRDRLQCILTSASVGTDEESVRAAFDFAQDLVGQPTHGNRLRLVRSSLQTSPYARPGTNEESAFLAELPSHWFQNAHQNLENLRLGFNQLLAGLGKNVTIGRSDVEGIRCQLGSALSDWPIISFLRETAGSSAKRSDELATTVFPDLPLEAALIALEALLNIVTFAKADNRPLISTRVHLFFRGLPPIYACINGACPYRRHSSALPSTLGRLYSEPRLRCECGSRTFMIASHRDCGALFIRGYSTTPDASFLWHEPGGEPQRMSIDFLLEPPSDMSNVEVVSIDRLTGRVVAGHADWDPERRLIAFRPIYKKRSASKSHNALRQVARRSSGSSISSGEYQRPNCPACGKRNSGPKIRDHALVGDRPFATLIREQLLNQSLIAPRSDRHPNGGRKTLIFSDGRQRAARLARDLPREVERDGFRQAIFAAADRLNALGRSATFSIDLYAAFVAVCSEHFLSFFDVDSGKLRKHVTQFRDEFDDLEIYFDEGPSFLTESVVPLQYRHALLRLVADPLYSVQQLQVAYIAPTDRALRSFLRRQEQIDELLSRHGINVSELAVAWISQVLDVGAFDPTIGGFQRGLIITNPKLADRYGLPSNLINALGLHEDQFRLVEDRLLDLFTVPVEGSTNRALKPETLTLVSCVDHQWWLCDHCHQFSAITIAGKCIQCGSKEVRLLLPTDPAIDSRSEYFRGPVRDAMAGISPVSLTIEEHTAQLGHRDRGDVWATTEEFELRFQDLAIGNQTPVDILSSTTTMEVGIDIGALNAVALGNVPPQRENYQQRAGRAGRRSSSVSTVITYARDDAHDAFYFHQPKGIISGSPRRLRIDFDNALVASRHLNALLVQHFFHEKLSANQVTGKQIQSNLFSSFGNAADFFLTTGPFSFATFEEWTNALLDPHPSRWPSWLSDWLAGSRIAEEGADSAARFIREQAGVLLHRLQMIGTSRFGEDGVDDQEKRKLLELFFEEGLFPKYAFPTDLCNFYVFESNGARIKIEQQMSQAKTRALGEYAPGRQLVVNKQTYEVNGLVLNAFGRQREELEAFFGQALDRVTYCQRCTYVRLNPTVETATCPICEGELSHRSLIDPPGFTGKRIDDSTTDNRLSNASDVQFPLPLSQEQFLGNERIVGRHLKAESASQQRLFVRNSGPAEAGFLVCHTCGAIRPAHPETDHAAKHRRAIPVQGSSGYHTCTGFFDPAPIILSHSFLTDVLLLRAEIGEPIERDPRSPQFMAALRTVSEALGIATARTLDIDPQDIQAGFRFWPKDGETTTVELFMFDTASGGAGYAVEAFEHLMEIINSTLALLEHCPGDCDHSCTQCLRHYGNRFWQHQLDRTLGRDLLRYLRDGTSPASLSDTRAVDTLRPLNAYLEMAGMPTELSSVDGKVRIVCPGKPKCIAAKPSLLTDRGYVAANGSADFPVLVSAFEIDADLPEAAHRVARAVGGQSPSSNTATPDSP